MTGNAPSEAASNLRTRRAAWGVLLAGSLAFLGLATGTAIGARFFVPEGSGLAGPAIALGHGFLGVLVGLAVAGLLIWKAPFRVLRTATVATLAIALCAVGLVTWRAVTLNQQQRADRGLDQPLPEPAAWTLESRLPESDDMRSYREIEIDASDWSFEYVAVGPEAAKCSGKLIGAEATNMVSLVSTVAARLEREPAPCGGSGDPPAFFLTLRGGAGGAFQEVEAGIDCLRGEPEISDLSFALRRIPIDAVSHARVKCK